MTSSQIVAQLQVVLAKRAVYVMLANRLDIVGKDVRHAKPFCAADCLGPRSTKSIAGSQPSPLHAPSFGLSLSADLAAG
jgi:hypothetical protein